MIPDQKVLDKIYDIMRHNGNVAYYAIVEVSKETGICEDKLIWMYRKNKQLRKARKMEVIEVRSTVLVKIDNKKWAIEIETYKSKNDLLYKYNAFNRDGSDIYGRNCYTQDEALEQAVIDIKQLNN